MGCAAVIQPEFISTSAKIGLALSKYALDEVAIKVLGVVIISSPSFNPIVYSMFEIIKYIFLGFKRKINMEKQVKPHQCPTCNKQYPVKFTVPGYPGYMYGTVSCWCYFQLLSYFVF